MVISTALVLLNNKLWLNLYKGHGQKYKVQPVIRNAALMKVAPAKNIYKESSNDCTSNTLVNNKLKETDI
jgi:hypothetical protein